jgi:HK97 family phage major capsid protein
VKKLFELRKERADKLDGARSIVQKAIDEKRALTPEEDKRSKDFEAEAVDLSRQIELFERADRLADEQRDAAGRLGPGQGTQAFGPQLPDLDGSHPYSVCRALRMMIEVREGVAGAKYDGIEAEVHQELRRFKPPGSEVRGILIPWQLANPRLARSYGLDTAERRDVTTTTAAGGIANILATPLIQFLRNRMVVERMGGTVLTGLEGGTFSLPKQTGKETAYHVAEGASPTNSNLTLGQVTWTPRTLAGRSAITRKTILQNSVDVEMLVRQSLVLTLAVEFDRVGINGSGQNAVPLGVMQDPNVTTVPLASNGAAPTFAPIVQLEKTVAAANAEFGRLGYVTSNAGRGTLKTTAKIGSTFPIFIWENDQLGVGQVNGYRAMSTEQVPSNLSKGSTNGTLTALIFGNWESATYGLWSGMDVLVDPYTASSSGGIIINIFQDYDFQQRWEQAFAKIVDMVPNM